MKNRKFKTPAKKTAIDAGLAAKREKNQKVGFWLMAVSIAVLSVITVFYNFTILLLVPLLTAFFIIFPKHLLWTLLGLHWIMYLPLYGDMLQDYKMNLGPVSVYLNDFLYLGLFFLVVYGLMFSSVKRRNALRYPLSRWILLYIAFIGMKMAWAAASHVPLDSVIREGSNYLACAYYIFAMMYMTEEGTKKLCRVGYFLWLIIPLFQVYMLLTGLTWQTDTGSTRTYWIGPNVFFLAVIAYKMLVDKATAKNALVIAYMVAGMAMTQYRSAFVALLFLLIMSGFFALKDADMKRTFVYPYVLAMALVFTLFAVFSFQPDYINKTYERYFASYGAEGTVKARMLMWDAGIKTFKNNPVFGISFGKPIYSDFSKAYSQEWSPHNFTIRLLAKTGVVGFGLVIGSLFSYFSFMFKMLLRKTPKQRLIRFGLVFTATLIIVHSMNTTFAHTRTAFVLWLFMGFTTVMVEPNADEALVHD